VRAALAAAVIASCGSAPAPRPPVLEGVGQLVTAVIDDWDATRATLRLWHRDGGTWVADGEPWQAVIGSGAAWGAGLHGRGAPAGRKGPVKREGDGRSPAGAFALRAAYGYADKPPAGTKLGYTAVDASWQCVDDAKSAHYAQILDRRTTKPDWRSAEQMHRDDALYTWVIDVAHNAERTPAAGSCIFLHVWAGPDTTTIGCTAMPEPQLAHLLARLDPARHPSYVLLTRADYAALAAPWGLPAQ